ncbi:MAG: NAD(P)/FAD-dependent oxidoreductase, partial [Acetobacteraceae bacterium]|nr:NAD(P)/FAD-dependent oxidoreductase [Acetobacteraceae bacterium]
MHLATPERPRLVVVGNGMAGMRTVEEILARTPHAFHITVFGAEPHPNYNRIMLSPVLAGEKTFDEIVINPREWYERNGIELIAGERVWHVDRTERVVHGEHGTTRPYDVLLLATGSHPFILPLVGRDLSGVIGFRDIGDVETMQRACARGGRAVVIGGGLLGLEAANGLVMNGMEVTVVHLMPTLMERQLDPAAGAMLKADLE